MADKVLASQISSNSSSWYQRLRALQAKTPIEPFSSIKITQTADPGIASGTKANASHVNSFLTALSSLRSNTFFGNYGNWTLLPSNVSAGQRIASGTKTGIESLLTDLEKICANYGTYADDSTYSQTNSTVKNSTFSQDCKTTDNTTWSETCNTTQNTTWSETCKTTGNSTESFSCNTYDNYSDGCPDYSTYSKDSNDVLYGDTEDIVYVDGHITYTDDTPEEWWNCPYNAEKITWGSSSGGWSEDICIDKANNTDHDYNANYSDHGYDETYSDTCKTTTNETYSDTCKTTTNKTYSDSCKTHSNYETHSQGNSTYSQNATYSQDCKTLAYTTYTVK